ncbi:MAG: Csu type fimbrial protein [Gammaproteobacteria bacterium]
MKHSQPDYRSISQRGAPLSLVLLLLSLWAFIPKTAWAASSCRANGNLTVTVSGTGVTFGSYDVMSAAATPGTGTVTVSATCTRANLPFTVNYSIALSTGGSGTFTPRSMTSGTSQLQYNLYTTASLTTIWGDGSGGTQTVADMITGTCTGPGGRNCSGSQPDTVYGNIPATQNVVAGSYTDTINVTVAF